MNASIFNEVLGPIMIGPSSSHTAGPARIGKMGWQLLGEPVKKISGSTRRGPLPPAIIPKVQILAL